MSSQGSPRSPRREKPAVGESVRQRRRVARSSRRAYGGRRNDTHYHHQHRVRISI